ncbi:lysozyme [Streptomyces varsoviensis]|uniref:Lysozyme n=1 Tax=Streptomyces varsoviensis TaxID=67373 RepID=A0ABR5J4X3_9ACTN|nr:lysozyme [Streptomyces varsoviensis]KOG88493.1 lysozyme [Streptomyces varsoviensis]
MPEHRSGPVRRGLRAPAGRPSALVPLCSALVLLLSLLALPATAAAADRPDPAANRTGHTSKADRSEPAHPDRDWMGSTLPSHEPHARAGQGAHPRPRLTASVEGVDVSSHNGNVNWQTLWNSGVRWAYVKATESTGYTNPYFAQQYNGSYNVGMIRGAYHFATPDTSSGAAQAAHFLAHGGGWSRDGKTLPGALDMEYNPYGAACYGKSPSAMVGWVRDFFTAYRAKTGRDPVIYTSTSWWKACTGNYAGFGATNPLWIPRYSSSVGELPAGWGFHTMWQYTSTGPTVGDHSVFNGAYDRLQALANG